MFVLELWYLINPILCWTNTRVDSLEPAGFWKTYLSDISLSKTKTFAVDSTVIFVTEVIFLGIYCTFVMRRTRSRHLSILLQKRKEKKISRLIAIACRLQKQSVRMQMFPTPMPFRNHSEPTHTRSSFFFQSAWRYPDEKTNSWYLLIFLLLSLKTSEFQCWNTCVYSLDISWCQSFNCKPV